MENNKEQKGDKNGQLKDSNYGLFYFILGILGLVISGYSLIYSFKTALVIGSITIGILIGVLSIFVIVYGYRIMKKDQD